jgi:hypothetical protein
VVVRNDDDPMKFVLPGDDPELDALLARLRADVEDGDALLKRAARRGAAAQAPPGTWPVVVERAVKIAEAHAAATANKATAVRAGAPSAAASAKADELSEAAMSDMQEQRWAEAEAKFAAAGASIALVSLKASVTLTDCTLTTGKGGDGGAGGDLQTAKPSGQGVRPARNQAPYAVTSDGTLLMNVDALDPLDAAALEADGRTLFVGAELRGREASLARAILDNAGHDLRSRIAGALAASRVGSVEPAAETK